MKINVEFLRKKNTLMTLSPEGDDIGQVEVFKSINQCKKKVRGLQAGNQVGRVRVVDRFPKTHVKQKGDQ